MKSRKSGCFPERFKVDKTRSIELGVICVWQGSLSGEEKAIVLRGKKVDRVQAGEGDVDVVGGHVFSWNSILKRCFFDNLGKKGESLICILQFVYLSQGQTTN